ncbi:hypothetical protein [Chamaesiphon sp.]|uniref:hypothetical protein n=1 Tax=Chamaesiphon sp. TaxID=2814140 RepID=UPI0035932578
MPTYRVFERQWQQVILLWVGRDLIDELKERFLEVLTNFEEQDGQFFYYRAYSMAGICINEFKSSLHAKGIVDRLVQWAFGSFDTERHEWIKFSQSVTDLAKETLFLTHKQCLISKLLLLLQNHIPDNKVFSSILMMLIEIDSNNQFVIVKLKEILEQPNLNDLPWYQIREILPKVAIDNEIFEMLVSRLKYPNLNYFFSSWMNEIFQKSSVCKEENIITVFEILNQSDLSESHRDYVTGALMGMTVGNKEILSLVLKMIDNIDSGEDHSHLVVESLYKYIIERKEIITASWELFKQPGLEYLPSSSIADALENIAVGNNGVEIFIGIIRQCILDLWHLSGKLEASEEITINNRSTIVELFELLNQNNLDDRRNFSRIAKIFREIISDNNKEILYLMELWNHPNLDYLLSSSLSKISKKILSSNTYVVISLLEIFKQYDLGYILTYSVGEILKEIAIDNEDAIATLLEMLRLPTLRYTYFDNILNVLRKIAINNEDTIIALIELLKSPAPNYDT